MTQIIKLTGIMLLVTSLSGCVVAIGNDDWDHGEQDWQDRQERNFRYINRLDLGRSLTSVEAELGNPDFSDAFQRDGEVFHVIYYRTHHIDDDGKTTRDETTPLVFIDKQLVGWGELAIEKATN